MKDISTTFGDQALKALVDLRRPFRLSRIFSSLCSTAITLALLLGTVPGHASVSVRNVPICMDDLCIVVPVTDDYVVKLADFNGDTKLDLYVTGHASRRFVSDFLLYQNTSQTYTLQPSPSSAEKLAARSAPISPVTVNRVELNADKYYDFYLRNVDEAITGAPDIIVTLTRGTGSAPSHVTPVNAELLSLIESITSVLNAPESYILAMGQQVCAPTPHQPAPYQIGMPSVWANVFFPDESYGTNEPPWSPFFGMFGTYTGLSVASQGNRFLVSLLPQLGSQTCKNVSDIVGPRVKNFIFALNQTRANPSFIDANAPPEVWTPVWCAGVYGRYSRSCPSYAFGGAGVLAGTAAGMALILAVLYYTGELSVDNVADIIDALESAANQDWLGPAISVPTNATPENASDVGPGIGAVPTPAVDKYAFQSNCNNGPTGTPPNRGTSVPGKSGDLKKNMSNVGCDCPAGSEAHHILPKGGGDTFPVDLKNRIRNCLNSAGVDVDHPGNGVCLPKKKDPNSNAVAHGSANGKSYWASVAQLCEDALDDSGPQGVRDMLDQARENLLNGNTWWKPGNGPFYPNP